MHHKNIAILITALDADGQAEMLKGIEESAKSKGYNVAVFLWFTGAFEKDKHNSGEINIIDLPDLTLFDGIILFDNALHIEKNRKKIEALLEEVDCPIVCIGCKMKDAPQIRTDTYTAMHELVEHYVVKHGMRRIHFVKGVKGNADAEARYRAYEDVLTENGIPIVPERISQGDFYVTGAEQAAREILQSKLPFPEAIVCANDIMASTICSKLMEKGYRVPEDVAISGYDCTLEGQMQYPKLTTVRMRSKELGKVACETLVDMLDGKNVEKEILLPDEVIYGESCGCQFTETTRGMHMIYGGAGIIQRKLIHQMIRLEKNIIAATTYNEWLEALKEFIAQINPPEFYYCVNDDFQENIFEKAMMEQEEMSGEERLAYSPVVKVLLAYQNGIFKNRSDFESRYAFEDLFRDTEKGKLYIFSPVHYLDRTFGYFVFVDSSFPVGNQLYVSWLINMGDFIENIRKQSLLRNAMKQLDDMYIRDPLTGVYNRFGMNRFFAEIKRKYLTSSHTYLQISFIDVDDLKAINDKYGHEEGDYIISTTAEILQNVNKKYYVIRYGGDEFIVMGTVSSEKDIAEYWQKVDEEIEAHNRNCKRQSTLSISYGYDIFKLDAKTYLEDCIHVTDEKMYIVKKEKKKKQE